MAENILKLRVDSDEYNNKIKRATDELQRYAEGCRKVGGTLEHVDEGVEEFVKALGQMQTVSNSAKGSVSELTKSFTELSVMYNKLTEEEKQGTFGKALAQSLETLKGRIQEGNAELKDIGKSLNDTGGFLGQLKDKFVVNIDAVKMFQIGLSAAKAALDVAKDAFFNNEQQLDEWGRIVESSESLYKGFLTALNTGDISGYLQRIDEITKAARDAYNAIDELNTFNAFNQINVEKTRTGMTESIVDYREGNATKEVVKAAGEAYKKELEERRKLEKDAYLKKVAEIAAQRGVSAEDLTTALSGKYGSYKALKEMPLSGTRTVFYSGGMFGGGGSYEQAVPGSVQEKLGDALRRLNDDELNNLQALGAQAERTSNEIAQVDRQLVRVLNGRQGGSGSGGGGNRKGGVSTEITYAADSITAMEKEVSELTKLWKDAGAAVRDQYAAQLAEAKLRLDEINGKSKKIMFDSEQAAKQVGFSQGKNAAQTSGIGNIDSFKNFKVDGLTPEALEAANKWMKDMEEGGNKVQKSWKNAASAIGLVGSAMASVKDPAAQIASTVAMAIANIAMAYSETLAKDKTNKSNIWYFIATAAAAMVSMTTTIASIHSATGYAQGGEIKGNSYSGDNIAGLVDGKQLVGLNAGEIVLNQAQQANVAHGLQGVGGNLHLEGILQGENILISTNRTAKRKGYGELMFWQGG